ncbi:MAG TPA: SDR family oxidoreductase [Armatimonadota bacterium]|nr:SDR family oxidoreductase [Armatimonadota bacterium]
MGKLDGKVAIITGGNRGIGAAIARAFAAEGCAVALAARDELRLVETARAIQAAGGTALPVRADITSEADVEGLFSRVLARFGRLDILVNNAGAFDGGPLDELSLETWEKVMAVNLRGPFLCTRAAFRIMKAQRGGRILNVASISAQRVRPNSAPYSTSKHGLWGLTQCAALEGRPYGIAASCLHPGNTLNERRAQRATEQDDEPMMTCEELAETALLMASLPPHVNMLEAIVLPVEQLYVGRG